MPAHPALTDPVDVLADALTLAVESAANLRVALDVERQHRRAAEAERDRLRTDLDMARDTIDHLMKGAPR